MSRVSVSVSMVVLFANAVLSACGDSTAGTESSLPTIARA